MRTREAERQFCPSSKNRWLRKRGIDLDAAHSPVPFQDCLAPFPAGEFFPAEQGDFNRQFDTRIH